MTRAFQAGTRRHGSATLDRARATRKKKPYKVVYEMVTQQKKKLRSTMAYSKHAPRGYTFVPLGNRDLTEECKEQCRKNDLVAHIVSTRSKADPPKDSAKEERNRIDTQRVGHHFPEAVVREACRKLHYHFTRKGFTKYRPAGTIFGGLQHLRDDMLQDGRQRTEKETKEQIRSAMLEVFPKIPQKDLEAIVGHAFEEGTKKVGNATDISLARRVQLAVGAYVRHQYTDYDAMLKERVSWAEARRLAEPASYAKLLEWRDETNNPELEEIFREIIVIDDEEGDDEDDDPDESDSFDSRSGDNSREPSFEIISSQARGRELQPDLAAGSRSHANGYHSRAPVSSGAYPSFSVAPPNPNSSSATLAQPRHSRVYSAAPLQRFRQPPTIKMSDGKLYELEPIVDHQWPPHPVAHPPRREERRADEGGYTYTSPLSRALDDTQIHRSAPLSNSSKLPEDIPLPSVERDSEPATVPKHFEKVPKTRDHQTRLVPVHRRGLDEAHCRLPKSATLGSYRDGRGGIPDVSYRYSRPTAYTDLVPPQPAPMLMPHKVPDREFVRANDAFRQDNDQIFIDLTTSPLRRSDRNKRYYIPASASPLNSVPSTVSNAYEPRQGFDIFPPEHRGVIVSNPREGDGHLRRVRSGYVESDSMETARGKLPVYGRRPY